MILNFQENLFAYAIHRQLLGSLRHVLVQVCHAKLKKNVRLPSSYAHNLLWLRDKWTRLIRHSLDYKNEFHPIFYWTTTNVIQCSHHYDVSQCEVEIIISHA